MNEDIQERVKEIKRSFRLIMDGATSTSMRDKGLDYKLNWGASLLQLRTKAEELGKDYHLAIALWKEDIRECKILATMIMPAEEMLPEITDIWMQQTPNIEIAEQAAFNLYQYLDYASDKAFLWLSSSEDLPQICGYHILSRLFIRKYEPNERDINEFIDQALVALQSSNHMLQKAAMQSMIHFAGLGLVYERLVQSATRRIHMYFV